MNVEAVSYGIVSKIVGPPVNMAAFDASSSQKDCVLVPAVFRIRY